MDPMLTRALSIFAPALIILLYGVLKTRGSALSFPVLAGLLAGMGCAVCALGLELAENRLITALHPDPHLMPALAAFGVAAPMEEGVKLLALLALLEFPGPRPMQRILLGALAISVGFAVFENYLYLTYAPETARVGLAVMRGSTAVPAHGLFSLVMGSLVVSAAIYPESRGLLLLLAFFVPFSLHGVYDLFALSPASTGLPQRMRWILSICAVIAIKHFNRVLRLARTEDANRGDAWHGPPRVRLFASGSIGLVWPVALALASIRIPALTGALVLIGVLPGTMSSDLLASAFRRDRTAVLH